jgi:YidC/Oxa1 family membrane protein insertase
LDIFLPIVAATQWALKGISSLVGNPGLGIIVFTIILRLITFPLTNKAMKSSLTMQTLSPLIKEIQRKYKGDQTRIMQETQDLYRQYGVSQLGGCLPLLLQIPIFITLSAAIFGLSMHKDPIFLQGFAWISNLNGPDPLHILPVASGLFQLIAQRMAIPPGRVLDGQAKMMNNLMLLTPIYIIFIYWGWATGPVLYWTTSSILQAVQSYMLIGWGSLTDIFPFLPKSNTDKFMPRKLTLEEIEANKAKKKGSLMGKLMEQSMAAQAGQQAKRNGAGEAITTTTATSGDQVKAEAPSRAVSTTTRISSGGNGSNSSGSSATIYGGYYSNRSNGTSSAVSNGASDGAKVKAGEPAASSSSRPTNDSSRTAAQQLTYEQMLARKKKRK